MSFNFIGQISTSKSMLNRALILQSLNPRLQFEGQSKADDVTLMRAALKALKERNPQERLQLDCGHAGTVLRFLALRVAREKGRFQLCGSARLFSRPLDELIKILRQLGAFVEVRQNALEIESDGWRLMGDQLYIPSDRSSQFATAVLLSAWDLPFEIFFRTSSQPASEPYFRMTWEMVKRLGMQIKVMGAGEYHIPAHQQMTAAFLPMEPDMSSAFAVAACATVAGELRLKSWPTESLQPDSRFVNLLEEMGVHVKIQGDVLGLSKVSTLKPIAVDVKNSPDLFPVLCALCAMADGESDISGIENLQHKESDRCANMCALLERLGVKYALDSSRLKIQGRGLKPWEAEEFEFDPDQDHRIYMAAHVLRWAGAPVKPLQDDVVDKSFPEFKELVLPC